MSRTITGLFLYTYLQISSSVKLSLYQFILAQILEMHKKLKSPLSIQWIPAHIGIPGNEAADKKAKSAAQDIPRDTDQGLSSLKDPIFAKFKKMANSKWDKRREKHKHGRYFRQIQPHRNPKALNKFKGLTRPMCAIFIQVCTGNIGLNNFFCSVQKAETNRCSWIGVLKQMAEHVPILWPKWAQLWQDTLWQGTRDRNLKTL